VRNRGPAPPLGESGGPWFARVGPEKLNRLRPDRFSGPLCVRAGVIDTVLVRA